MVEHASKPHGWMKLNNVNSWEKHDHVYNINEINIKNNETCLQQFRASTILNSNSNHTMDFEIGLWWKWNISVIKEEDKCESKAECAISPVEIT
jgi:hypothetical protein